MVKAYAGMIDVERPIASIPRTGLRKQIKHRVLKSTQTQEAQLTLLDSSVFCALIN